jgi:hypothetical protein
MDPNSADEGTQGAATTEKAGGAGWSAVAWTGASLAAGLVAGILAKMADAPGSWEAGIITSNVAVWVLGVGLWGALSRRPVDAVTRSIAFFLTTNLGYYGWAAVVLRDPWPPIATGWIVIGLTAAPAAAVAVHGAVRSRAWWSGSVLAVVAAIALTDEPVSRAWRWAIGGERWLPQAPVAAVIALATWVAVVLVLPRHHSTRLWGLVFAVPAFLLVDWLFRVSWPTALSL